MAKDLYNEVTDRILAMLDKGVIPWRRPWSLACNAKHGAYSHATGKPNSFVNQMLLSRPGEYVTFQQAKKEGGHVKKGAKSECVYFFKKMVTDDVDKDGNVKVDKDGHVKTKTFPWLKYICVFHIDDTEGLKPRMKEVEEGEVEFSADNSLQLILEYAKREGITLELDSASNRAFYRPATDTIVMPHRNQFAEEEEYFSTLFHESVHSTGHEKRLNRLENGGFGSEPYSREELVAEMGSAMILFREGLTTEATVKNNVAYIQSWSRKLREDKRLFIWAARRAEAAANLIYDEKPEAEDQEQED